MLTREQIKDLNTRLTSFAAHGIVPAQQVATHIPNPIPSAEQRLAPHVCLNVISINPSNASHIYDLLNYHDSHGFINMSIERNYVATIQDKATLEKTVTERLLCSFVFILKKPTRKKDDITKPLVSEEGIALDGHELRTDQCFMKDQILAILVPAPFSHLVKEVFPDIPIVSAPMIHGQLHLSTFTLGTTLWADFFASEDSIHVAKPDYTLALKSWMKKNSLTHLDFATHITRFSTQQDLQNPYKPRSPEEMSQMCQKMQIQLLKRFFSAKCRFTPDPYQRYAVPCELMEVAKKQGAKEVKEETPRSSEFVLMEMQSSQLKDQKNGGIRQLLKIDRKRCSNLSEEQLKFLKTYPVTIEEELTQNGNKKFLITYPEKLEPIVTKIGLDWQSLYKSTCRIQSFFRNTQQKRLQNENLLVKLQGDIKEHNENFSFSAVAFLAKQAAKIYKKAYTSKRTENEAVLIHTRKP